MGDTVSATTRQPTPREGPVLSATPDQPRSSVTPAAPPRLRADAERNRRLIVEAALAAWAQGGTEIPLEEIAQRAGVGVGTLYRRFPDRAALVIAVISDGMSRATERLRDAHRTEPTAWDALVSGLTKYVESPTLVRQDRPLPMATVASLRADPDFQLARREFVDTLSEIVHAAQAEGSLRPDVGTGDIAQLLTLLKRAPNLPPDTAALVSARALRILLDGLRADAAHPLPGRPLTSDDILPQANPSPGAASGQART